MPADSPLRQPWQRYLAEFIGTFAIVFAGCGAVITNQVTGGGVSHLGISITFGAIVAAMIYALGPISAAHFNPAVTIGFATARRFPWRFVPQYIGAQCLGAIFASALHALLYNPPSASAATFGATLTSLSFPRAAGLEVIMTFFLMLVIMAMATDKRAPAAASGLAIGITVMLCSIFGGPLTGASMNPARTLGPALMVGPEALRQLPLYFIAPPIGAIIAALTYELLRDGTLHAQHAPADLEQAMKLEPGLTHE